MSPPTLEDTGPLLRELNAATSSKHHWKIKAKTYQTQNHKGTTDFLGQLCITPMLKTPMGASVDLPELALVVWKHNKAVFIDL